LIQIDAYIAAEIVLQTQITNIIAEKDSIIAQCEEESANLNIQITTLEGEKTTLINERDSLNVIIEGNNTYIFNLEGQNANLTSQNTDL
jgi:hypothetical protein